MVDVHSLYDAIVDEKGSGDYLLPSDAFANGAVNVFVRRGIYLEVDNVVIPDGGQLTGELQGDTIIDFQNTGFSVRGDMGTTPSINSTGTIALVSGTNGVVGTGTDFTSPGLNPGDWLTIHSNMYEIATVVDATNLTLVKNYNGRSQTGLSFKALPMTSYNKVQNLTIRNSTVAGISFIASRRVKIENVTVDNCDPNYSFDNTAESALVNCASDSSQGIGVLLHDCESFTCSTIFSTNNASHGFVVTGNCHDLLLNDFESSSNGGSGFYITGTFMDSSISKCVGKNNYSHGIYIINADTFVVTGSTFSGNGGSGISSSGHSGVFTENVCENNNNTGVALTGDLCVVSSSLIRDNQDGITIAGYGNMLLGTVAIDSTNDCCHLEVGCDYPIVICCNFSGAGSSSLNNEATNSLVSNCIP